MPTKNLKLLAKGLTDTRPISSCSTFAATDAATPDGEAMVSITGGAFLEVTNSVILVVFSTDGERFISLTYAGRIANNDTFVRYDTVSEKLSEAPVGTVDLDFTKVMWASNDWYDSGTETWYTVPVPNDFDNYNICYVPGNLREGGEYQIIQFPAQNTTYLQLGVPQGTSIENYWPETP